MGAMDFQLMSLMAAGYFSANNDAIHLSDDPNRAADDSRPWVDRLQRNLITRANPNSQSGNKPPKSNGAKTKSFALANPICDV